MDPDENLKTQRDLSHELSETLFDDEDKPLSKETEETCARLAESVQAMDEWIRRGGFIPKEWARNANGGLLKRAELAVRVYDEVIEGSETFEGELGIQLAYLLGAILKGTQITLDMSNVEQDEVHQFFGLLFPGDHPVWSHVRVENQGENDVSSS